MSVYKKLLCSIFLYYLFVWLVIAVAFIFIDVPLFVQLISFAMSIINLVVIYWFNRAINILPDEN